MTPVSDVPTRYLAKVALWVAMVTLVVLCACGDRGPRPNARIGRNDSIAAAPRRTAFARLGEAIEPVAGLLFVAGAVGLYLSIRERKIVKEGTR